MKRLWIQVHLWLGLSLGVLGIFIGITGSILVYDHGIDAWLNPQRYAVSGAQVALPYGEYVKRAAQALEGRARPQNVRLPDAAGMPVVVLAREGKGGAPGGGFARLYLDPPTGKVLEIVPGGGFIGWVRTFHDSLTLREYLGREIVGLVGVAMLMSSLSGLYLWWPARGRFREALGARPGLRLSRNLHYLFGFYGAIVLAMLSFTGVWLAYPDAGRAVVSTFSTIAPPARNLQATEAVEGAKPIPLEEAIRTAQALYPGAPVAGFGLPAGPRGTYRVNLNTGGSTAPVNNAAVFVDPRSGTVLRNTGPATRSGGDNFLVMQRLLHAGEVFGPAGRALIFICGLLPALFVTTGTLMWLRKRGTIR